MSGDKGIDLSPELRNVLDAMPVAVEICDSRGLIIYVNPAFSKVTGLASNERVGASVFDVSPDGALAQTINTGRAVSGLKNHPKGTTVTLVSNSNPLIVAGKTVGAIAVMQDVTELIRLSKALSATRRRLESLEGQVRSIFTSRFTFEDIVGTAPPIVEARTVASKVAMAECAVLITGESGVGKELFAHAIHSASPRANKPFVTINCSAIPSQLLESEFFGYERGAFTGATTSKSGLAEVADGGTVFLDEIADMNIELQAKVLRLIQFGEIQKVGSLKPMKVDIRVLAATNKDLKRLAEKGLFRPDLYYRLSAVIVEVPPLRSRREDIPLLIQHLLPRIMSEMRRELQVDQSFIDTLADSPYEWPGNVRELENVLRQAVISVTGQRITAEHVPLLVSRRLFEENGDHTLRPISEVEKELILKGLNRYGRSVDGKRVVARKLGISLSALYNKIRVYGL